MRKAVPNPNLKLAVPAHEITIGKFLYLPNPCFLSNFLFFLVLFLDFFFFWDPDVCYGDVELRVERSRMAIFS